MTSSALNRGGVHKSTLPALLSLFCTALSLSVHAQRIQWNVAFTTEGLWEVRHGKTRWNNLLEAGTGIGLWKGAQLELSAISTFDTGNPTCEDRQGLSNIETGENKAFRLTHAGLCQQFGRHWNVFAGLRSVDADYFTSPLTSLFTGSSHGIYPVLSENFPVGTYPLSAVSLHVEYSANKHVTLKESVYNGVASDRLNRQFGYRPRSEGTLNTGSFSYMLRPDKQYSGHYTIGYILGTQPAVTARLSYNYALWALTEQAVANMGHTRFHLLLQGGLAPASRSQCRSYWGVGTVLSGVLRNGKGNLGLAVNRAVYTEGTETDTELTACFPVFNCCILQPAVHVIRTDGHTALVSLLRLCIEVGN